MRKEEMQVSDKEMKQIAAIYKKLSEPKRNIWAMGGNLLLASQEAENLKDRPTRKTG